MDTTKLDTWADKLLDTGKRNNLINFKDRKGSTAEILAPSSETFFDSLESSFRIYVPQLKGDSSEELYDFDDLGNPAESTEEGNNGSQDGQQRERKDDIPRTREGYLKKYAGELGDNQLLCWTVSNNPGPTIRKIWNKTREFISESGINATYLAFGFIHWQESESSHQEYKAPVLLVPVTISQENPTSSPELPYVITPSVDEIEVNPSFSHKLKMEYGITLPEYDQDHWNSDDPRQKLSEYLNLLRKLPLPPSWTVTDECKLGFFAFQKINMYNDLKQNSLLICGNPNIRRLMEQDSAETQVGFGDANGSTVRDPLVDLHTVVDADSSQLEAIKKAKLGESFVLQGPPGTGKSQTITNIIAECLGDGKKVLFVSEKIAALNVVYNKLKQVHLDDFCLELHSYKANSKALVDDVLETLDAPKSRVSDEAAGEIDTKKASIDKLDRYMDELMKTREMGETLYGMYGTYLKLKDTPNVEFFTHPDEGRNVAEVQEARRLLRQFSEYVPTIGRDYRQNPWYGFKDSGMSVEDKAGLERDFATAADNLEQVVTVGDNLTAKYGIPCDSIDTMLFWVDFLKFVAGSRAITPALLHKKEFVDAVEALRDLRELGDGIHECKDAIDEQCMSDVYLLNGEEGYRTLNAQFKHRIRRLFDQDCKSVIDSVRQVALPGRSIGYSEARRALFQLSKYQQMVQEYEETAEPVKALFGSEYDGLDTDWDRIQGGAAVVC